MFEDFGERLRRLRLDSGYTQKELGQKVGVGTTSICKYESGAMKPTIDVAVELAYNLGVSLDRLFGYDEPGKVSMFGLSAEQKEVVVQLITLFQKAPNGTLDLLSDEQNELVGKIVSLFIINNRRNSQNGRI